MLTTRYKYITNTGEDAFGLEFDHASPFDAYGFASVGVGNRSFYINTEGINALETSFNQTMFDKYGLGPAYRKDGRHYRYGMLTTRGDWLIPLEYDSLGYKSSGLFCARLGRECLCLDSSGKQFFKFGKYRLLDSNEFHFDRLLVGCEGNSYFMDTVGKIVLGPYWSAQMFCDGLAYVKTSEDSAAFFVDVHGNKIFGTEAFEYASEYWENDLLEVQQGDKYGLIAKNGTFAVEPNYESLEWLGDSYYQATIGGEHLVMNGRGDILTKLPPGLSVRYCEKGIVRYERDEKWGYMSIQDGTVITDAIFADAGPMRHGLAPVAA